MSSLKITLLANVGILRPAELELFSTNSSKQCFLHLRNHNDKHEEVSFSMKDTGGEKFFVCFMAFLDQSYAVDGQAFNLIDVAPTLIRMAGFSPPASMKGTSRFHREKLAAGT